MERTIEVNDKMLIGWGDFANIFRINRNHIAKVYCGIDIDAEKVREGEVIGSRLSRHCLPILELVQAKYYHEEFDGFNIFPAVIKRYIKYRSISQKDVNKMISMIASNSKAYSMLGWDIRDENIGKTARGKLYLLDTQLRDWGY